MAIDEAILEAVAAGESPPTLRFYAWEPACLSLGYAQPFSDVDPARLAERGWGLVRRPTGGRAILHTDELTYSVVARLDDPHLAGGVLESYRHLSAGLMRGVEMLGVRENSKLQTSNPKPQSSGPHSARSARIPHSDGPVCFETPSAYEITANGKKLIGSAQVRKRGAALQHGTLPLSGDIARICDALAFADDEEREAAKARVRERATTLADALGAEVAWTAAAEAIASGFSEALGLQLERGELGATERARAESLVAQKYSSPAWNERL